MMNNVKRMMTLAVSSMFVFASCAHGERKGHTLKEAFEGKFLVGTALNIDQIGGFDTASLRVVKTHFNAIVAENCMKSEQIQPREGVFEFAMADRMVEFGEANGMQITGHTLIWHSQTPRWFFKDSQGNDVTREVLIERMRTHIHTVVGRYKGRIKGWDVVNEVIDDRDGSYRKSKFYQIIGEDYIKLAFQFAHEADPDAELYYNDYSLTNSRKRKGAVEMVKKLLADGVRIDAVGEQCHVGLEEPTLAEYEQTIKDFAALGVKVMVTEMEISVLPMDWSLGADVSARMEYKEKSDLYVNGLPDDVNAAFEQRYLDFFNLFLKYQDVITRVTLWGVNDGNSWKNNWPIPGRTDYPLLFDRKNLPKPVVAKLIEAGKKN
ncbi:endo-1,4-beta-xylanase [Breznakibacter xylanolyticus]|uniref:Beta-xylanase n=1 Tax=Breznakibacter xylanolyticus TaxID=990 RepID=A0A2W7MZ41_9BACT|nr:endo-1,4-beta-xylanase [Breznakibacter xylanolyticus]PZX13405.1 endo-1,4-beta-xylanase [Breznakibacter xylanolyticus]